MILILNYLPVLIILAGMFLAAYLYTKNKFAHIAVVGLTTLGLVLVIKAATPSYMPKGTVPKLPLVVEQEESPPMQNRILKPEMTKEERDAHFEQQFDAVKK